MKTINLLDFYYWYTQDEFVEVSDEVAEELLADKRYQKNYARRMRYNKTYFFDTDTETEAAGVALIGDNPEAVFDMMERHCRLCCALNSLPEIQGHRIEAHYMLGKSRKEIAAAEGVSESSMNESIERGLRAMKKYLRNFENCPVKCHSRPL